MVSWSRQGLRGGPFVGAVVYAPMPMPPVTVSVPPDERYARVLRLMASAAGAAAGLAVDRLDDLKLAVDEAVGVLLLEGRAPSTLTCGLAGTGGTLSVRVTGTGDSLTGWPPAGWDDSLPALVLEGVADEVALTSDAGNPGVAFQLG